MVYIPKKRTQVVPAHPEPYIRQPNKGRGRPKKNGRPKKYKHHDSVRASPAKRAGARWITVALREEAYFMLKEIATFNKKPLGQCLHEMLIPVFEQTYKDSLTLQRIAATREKAKNETPNTDDVPRRTHF